MPEPRIVERDNPEDVFSLLSDDIRVDILQALWQADEPLAFSELYEAVEIGDSGQFNYHLDKLIDRFVRKTPDGYELTQAGKGINGAIEAGAYTLEASIEPIELESTCQHCGGGRTLSYEDEVVDIACESCEVTYHFVVPPGVFAGYESEAVPRVASQYLYATFQKIKAGFCWFCEGQIRPSVKIQSAPAKAPAEDGSTPEGAGTHSDTEADDSGRTGPTADSDGDLQEVPVVHYDCDRCGHRATTGLTFATLDHPAVQSFYYEQGIDVRDHYVWEFPELDPDYFEVRSREPVRASVTYAVDGERLTLVLDQEADVVEVER